MKQAGLLALLIALFFSVTLGMRPYGTPSEARYIEVPRQMVTTGDWLTPRLNGVKYFEKPPLFYWLQAAQFQLFDMGEFSGRFWTMALMVALCMITYATGKGLYNRRSGHFAAIALASSVLGFALSRIVLLDVPVSLFLSGTLFSFLLAINAPIGRKRDILLMLMYVSAALAVLTKGLIGAVLPGLVIAAWIALTSNWQLLRQVRLISGGLLFLAITIPWHILVGIKTPEFTHFYFIHEHFQRYLTPEAHRVQPWWFFGAVLIAGWLPWTFFLPQALRAGFKGAWDERRANGTPLFLLLWTLLLFVFFSASHSKLIPYILPVFPPLALLLGHYASNCWQQPTTASFRRSISAVIAMLIALLLAAAIMWNKATQRGWLEPQMKPTVTILLIWLGLTALTLATLLCKRRTTKPLLIALLTYSIGQALLIDLAAAHDPRESVKIFAEYLKPRLQPNEEVAVFRHYYQDLPVYLNHNVTVVDAEGELTFGTNIEPRTHDWMIDTDTFWQRWTSANHPMYMVIHKNVLQELKIPNGAILQPIMETDKDVLIMNHDTPND